MEPEKSVGEYTGVSIFPKRPIIPPEMLCRQKPPARGFLTQFTFQSYHEPLFFNFNFKTTWNPKSVGEYPGDVFKSLSFPNTSQFQGKCCAGKTPPRGITTQFTFQSYHAPLFFHFTYKATWNRKISRRIYQSLHFSQTPIIPPKCCAGKNRRPEAS